MDTTGLTQVRLEIAAAASRAGVKPASVVLVAVSKGRTSDEVIAAADAGQRVFAENRQQGLALRVGSDLPEGIEWHFVGPLQRRKVPFVADHVSLLHSMDRMSLADKWLARGDTPVLLQFNLGKEPQKSGFDPLEADAVLDRSLEVGLQVTGVMAIPPQSEDPESTRPYFHQLRVIFDRYRDRHGAIEHCSMGMSNDFSIAIEEGSTMVRIGRAIFEPTDR
jgi:pyridoxal phosphate enzyme (YggS family)